MVVSGASGADQSVCRSVGLSVGRSVGQSVCRSVCRLPVGGLVNRLVYFPVFFTFSLMNDEHTVPDILRLLAKSFASSKLSLTMV